LQTVLIMTVSDQWAPIHWRWPKHTV